MQQGGMLKQRAQAPARTPGAASPRPATQRSAPATVAPKRAGRFVRSVGAGTRATAQQIKPANAFGVQHTQRTDSLGLASLRDEAMRMSSEQVSALNKIDALTKQYREAETRCKEQKEELAVAEQRICKLETDLMVQAKAFQEIKSDIDGAGFKIEDMGAALAEADKSIAEADGRASGYDTQLDAADEARAGLSAKCGELEAAHLTIKRTMKNLEQTHASIADENAKLKSRSDSLHTAAEEANADAAGQRERAAALDAEVDKLKQQLKAQEASAAERDRIHSSELDEVKAASSDAAAREKEAGAAAAFLKDELARAESEHRKLKEERDGAETALVSWRAKHAELGNQIAALQTESDGRGKQLEASAEREKKLEDALTQAEQSKVDEAARVEAMQEDVRKQVSDKYTAAIDKLNAKHAAELKDAQDQAAKQHQDALAAAKTAATNAALAAHAEHAQQLAAAVRTLEDELERARAELAAAAASAAERDGLLESTAAELNEYKRSAAENAETIAILSGDAQQLQATLNEKVADYEELKKASAAELAKLAATHEREQLEKSHAQPAAVPPGGAAGPAAAAVKKSSRPSARATRTSTRVRGRARTGTREAAVAGTARADRDDANGLPHAVRFDAASQPPRHAQDAAAGEPDFTAVDDAPTHALDGSGIDEEHDHADGPPSHDALPGAETEDAMAALLGGLTPVEEVKRGRRAASKGTKKHPSARPRAAARVEPAGANATAAPTSRHRPPDAYVSTGETEDARLPGNLKVLPRIDGTQEEERENLIGRFEQARDSAGGGRRARQRQARAGGDAATAVEGSSGESPNVIAAADKDNRSTARGAPAKPAADAAAPKPRSKKGQQTQQKKHQAPQRKKPAAAASSVRRAQPAVDEQRPSKRARVTAAPAKRAPKKSSQDPYDLDTLSMCDAFGF